jgi:hypothetical protein
MSLSTARPAAAFGATCARARPVSIAGSAISRQSFRLEIVTSLNAPELGFEDSAV